MSPYARCPDCGWPLRVFHHQRCDRWRRQKECTRCNWKGRVYDVGPVHPNQPPPPQDQPMPTEPSTDQIKRARVLRHIANLLEHDPEYDYAEVHEAVKELAELILQLSQKLLADSPAPDQE